MTIIPADQRFTHEIKPVLAPKQFTVDDHGRQPEHSQFVIAGGIGRRLSAILPNSDFSSGFTNKGRFSARMAGLPVKLIDYPEPGLLGAASAFLLENTHDIH